MVGESFDPPKMDFFNGFVGVEKKGGGDFQLGKKQIFYGSSLSSVTFLGNFEGFNNTFSEFSWFVKLFNNSTIQLVTIQLCN